MDTIELNEESVCFSLKNKSPFISKRKFEKLKKLKLSRAIFLSSVSYLLKDSSSKMKILDGLGGVGFASTQLLQNFGEKIDVTLNVDNSVLEALNSDSNHEKIINSYNVISEDLNVIMYQQKYDLIYLESTGSVLLYLEAALRSINDNGFLILTSCDILSLLNKNPVTTQRLYGAKLYKTPYLKEMSIRVIISNVVRAASKWNKGIKVKTCAVTKDSFTIVCQVTSSLKLAESNSKLIRHLAHCIQCEEKRFLNNGLYITNYIPKFCECEVSDLNPVLILGSMWAGKIFDANFTGRLWQVSLSFDFESSTAKYFKSACLESYCFNKMSGEIEYLSNVSDEPTNQITADSKHDEVDELAFYFDIKKHSKSSSTPTIDSVITKLRNNNFRASRSHFGDGCIRTSASINQIELSIMS